MTRRLSNDGTASSGTLMYLLQFITYADENSETMCDMSLLW